MDRGVQPADVVKKVNRGLQKALQELEQVARMVRDQEHALTELEAQRIPTKDSATMMGLSRANMEVQKIRGAIQRLEMELAQAESRLKRLQW
jgi:hypothetical protein